LDENVQSNLGARSWDTFRLHEDDHSRKRAPQHFGQKFRLCRFGPSAVTNSAKAARRAVGVSSLANLIFVGKTNITS
jgi:hypothetical protein